MRDYLRFGPAGVVRLFAQTTRYPTLERAQAVEPPALVVVGTRDPLAPPPARLARLRRDGASGGAVVEGAAHGVCFSHPDEVGRLASSWLGPGDGPASAPGRSGAVGVPHD